MTAQPVDHTTQRDLLAIVIVAIACPLALFGGSLVGCVGKGFDATCALSAWYISPVILIGAGVLAGLVTRGWFGLFLMWVGVAIGMTALMFLTFVVDRPVPLDPISGFIATVWFLAPVLIGYGIGRGISHVAPTRTPKSGDPA